METAAQYLMQEFPELATKIANGQTKAGLDYLQKQERLGNQISAEKWRALGEYGFENELQIALTAFRKGVEEDP